MKTAWIKNLVLVAVVTALALYALRKPDPQDALKRYEIATLDRTAIERIAIEAKGAAPIELRKQGEDWMLVQPIAARADRTQVERMLDLLTARSDEKLAPTQLQRFDLEAPALKVRFDDHAIAFGTTNPVTNDLYVLSGDGVYLLGPYFRSLVPEDAQRLLTHALFRTGEKPVAFVLPAFSVQQQDSKWTLDPAPGGGSEKERPSQDDLNAWVDGWKLASSLLTQPSGERVPGEWIDVRLADGASVRLGILQREPELVLMRADEKLSFYYSPETGKRLLEPPAAEPPATPAAASSPAVEPPATPAAASSPAAR